MIGQNPNKIILDLGGIGVLFILKKIRVCGDCSGGYFGFTFVKKSKISKNQNYFGELKQQIPSLVCYFVAVLLIRIVVSLVVRG